MEGEDRPEIKFNWMNLFRWFHKQAGTEKSPMEKPYLSQEQKKEHNTKSGVCMRRRGCCGMASGFTPAFLTRSGSM